MKQGLNKLTNKLTDKELIQAFLKQDKIVHNDYNVIKEMDRMWFDMFVEELHTRGFKIKRTTEVKK